MLHRSLELTPLFSLALLGLACGAELEDPLEGAPLDAVSTEASSVAPHILDALRCTAADRDPSEDALGQEVLRLLNAERARISGAGPLQSNGCIDAVAQAAAEGHVWLGDANLEQLLAQRGLSVSRASSAEHWGLVPITALGVPAWDDPRYPRLAVDSLPISLVRDPGLTRAGVGVAKLHRDHTANYRTVVIGAAE